MVSEKKERIIRWNPASDGGLGEAAMRKKLEKLGYLVHRYDYPPGTVFSEHTHPVDKVDGVLAGEFKISMEGREFILKAGDAIHVPAGTPHAAEVIGSETVVSLDAIKKR